MFKDVKFSFAGEILEKKRFSYISTANFPPNRTFSLPLQFSEDLVTPSRENPHFLCSVFPIIPC